MKNITDESWREFWRWLMNELRELRLRAYIKYPDHCAHLHGIGEDGFGRLLRRRDAGVTREEIADRVEAMARE